MDFLRQLWRDSAEAWQRLSASARVNIVLAGLVVVVLIGLMAYNASSPQYVTISTNLAGAEANRVVDALQSGGIPYRLTDNNQTVQVPITQRSAAQLLLSESNLPVGRPVPPGWEIFAESELMTNQWLQDVKFMRAVQGELQRLLNAYDFVDFSYVLIRESPQELFVSDQKPSEAAVTLKVNRPLTKQEVRALVNNVAAAGGPNLHPGNITLTTTEGTVLHQPPTSEYASLANSKLELTADLERRAELRIMDSLRDLGKRGTVRVSAKVDFDERRVLEESITEGAEISSLISTSSSTTTESPPEGAPGAFANVPEGTVAPGGVTSSEETSEELLNFEPSRRTTETRSTPGEVVQYTVALIVEGDREATADDEAAGGESYVGLTDARREFYRNLVLGAVGSGAENTVVTVDDHPFDIGPLAATATALEQMQTGEGLGQYAQWGGYLLQGLLILLGFILIRSLLTKAIVRAGDLVEEEEVKEIPAATREDLRRQEVSNEIGRLAATDPDAMAAILRSWMAEDEE